ncbi:MAPEG family protein [Sphingomonas solaris]|uniref:MAPEG family protein n=1 Tax=Alterirhizorhabdus solaris TaxID=2529389 RepID=A0A558QWK4_9SPHN|nr:MAPEG family protein [Sphingomonas solaris]TVV71524.1 MAPEG family protein [Sphingomonas solaris]
MILPITLTIAAAAALLNVWLAVRAGRVRLATKVDIGDGGNPQLIARMRAHANFVEYTPFFLILLGLIELAHGPATWLWIVSIVYILARIAHAFGMDRPAPNPFRAGGIILTFLILIGLAGYALSIPYLTPVRPVTTIVGG